MELENRLQDEVQKASGLEVNLKRMEGDLVESSARVSRLLEQEKVLQDRCRGQVRWRSSLKVFIWETHAF